MRIASERWQPTTYHVIDLFIGVSAICQECFDLTATAQWQRYQPLLRTPQHTTIPRMSWTAMMVVALVCAGLAISSLLPPRTPIERDKRIREQIRWGLLDD